MQIWYQLRIKIEKIAAEIAPSNGAILDEFIKKYFMCGVEGRQFCLK